VHAASQLFPRESQHSNRCCDKLKASLFDTYYTCEPSLHPEWMSFERNSKAGMLALRLSKATAIAKLSYWTSRSYKRPDQHSAVCISSLRSRSTLFEVSVDKNRVSENL